MRTGTKVFLVIFVLILAGAAVIGIDVYLSYKAFQDNPGAFSMTTPTIVLASDNSSVDVTATITTPKLGYMPKSARIDIILMNGTEVFGDPLQVTVKLGTSQEVNFTIVFEIDIIAYITDGNSIALVAELTATPIYIGIPLNFLQQELDDILINLP